MSLVAVLEALSLMRTAGIRILRQPLASAECKEPVLIAREHLDWFRLAVVVALAARGMIHEQRAAFGTHSRLRVVLVKGGLGFIRSRAAS